MFGGLGGTEFLVIILIAIFLWGPDKLPQALANLRRFISKARNMASNAASDLSREIGTEIKPEDLNPKTFVRKHILTEEDQEMLTNPLKSTMRTSRTPRSRSRTTSKRPPAGSTTRAAPSTVSAAGSRRGRPSAARRRPSASRPSRPASSPRAASTTSPESTRPSVPSGTLAT
ncbi:hypothetical protein GCM10029992_27330 [Glycomyces albus]